MVVVKKNKELKRTIYSVIHNILFHIHKMDNGIVHKIPELYNILLFNNIINKISIFFYCVFGYRRHYFANLSLQREATRTKLRQLCSE